MGFSRALVERKIAARLDLYSYSTREPLVAEASESVERNKSQAIEYLLFIVLL